MASNYTIVFRFTRSEDLRAAPENRFVSGVLNAIAMSVPLWALAVWAARSLF